MPTHFISRDRVQCRATSLAYAPFTFDLEQFPPLGSTPTIGTLELQWSSRPRVMGSTRATKVDDEQCAPNNLVYFTLLFPISTLTQSRSTQAQPQCCLSWRGLYYHR
jgi:hypothetical protein